MHSLTGGISEFPNLKKNGKKKWDFLLGLSYILIFFFPQQVSFSAYYILEHWVMLFNVMRAYFAALEGCDGYSCWYRLPWRPWSAAQEYGSEPQSALPGMCTPTYLTVICVIAPKDVVLYLETFKEIWERSTFFPPLSLLYIINISSTIDRFLNMDHLSSHGPSLFFFLLW